MSLLEMKWAWSEELKEQTGLIRYGYQEKGWCPLPFKCFKHLLALAAARLLFDYGWISKEEVEPGENASRYLFNLRKKLHELELSDRICNGILIEGDRKGNYRLSSLSGKHIQIALTTLLDHDDFEIKRLAERIQKSLP